MARPAIKLGQLTVLRDKKSAWLSRKILWREETQQRTSPPPSYPSRLCITAKQDPGGRGGSPVPNDDRSINFIKHPSRRAEMRDGLEAYIRSTSSKLSYLDLSIIPATQRWGPNICVIQKFFSISLPYTCLVCIYIYLLYILQCHFKTVKRSRRLYNKLVSVRWKDGLSSIYSTNYLPTYLVCI